MVAGQSIEIPLLILTTLVLWNALKDGSPHRNTLATNPS